MLSKGIRATESVDGRILNIAKIVESSTQVEKWFCIEIKNSDILFWVFEFYQQNCIKILYRFHTECNQLVSKSHCSGGKK